MNTADVTRPRAARPRADALRNRERIVSAAREMFADHGPDVALDEIARRAGVGNATVYRHFPDRAALFRGVMLHVVGEVAGLAETARQEGATDPGGPFAALRRFVHAAAGERIGAVCPMLLPDFDKNHPELVAATRDLEDGIAALLDLAQLSGQLRDDVGVGDLMVALAQLTRPLPGSACPGTEAFVHRHLEIFVDGLAAPARSSVLPGVPATVEALRNGS